MRVDVARALDLQANRFDIDPEIAVRCCAAASGSSSCRSGSMPGCAGRARSGKIGWRDGVRALQVLVAERFKG